jgi:hypothetical protein
MSIASPANAYRPLCVLPGGPFAPQRSIEPKPLVCALLRSRPRPVDAVGHVRSTGSAFLATHERLAIMVDRYRKQIAAMVIQLVKDDPQFVKEMIQKLRRSGEIEVDDLRYLERIADKWIAITEKNLQKARR